MSASAAPAAAAPAIAFEGICKSFFGVQVLENVTFALQAGHVLGLIGENGAGKSTLMNIVGGVLAPDAGSMSLHGRPYAPQSPREATRAGVAFIHQELNLFTNLSIAENLMIEGFPRRRGLPFFDRRAVNDAARRHLQTVGLDVPPDTRVERLSVGERQLVEIAKALGTDASVIIFDEPTTSLTARESERLFALMERLRADGRSLVYISHVLGDVERMCDDVVVLRDGAVVGSGPRAELPVRRMISLMVGRDIEQLYPERTTAPAQELALEVREVSQPGIVEKISFAVRRGEVVGLFGLMGSGRTELARILFGLDPHASGEIVVAGVRRGGRSPRRSIRDGVAFVTENRREEGLLMDISITDNLALASLQRHARKPLPVIAQGRLASFADDVAQALHIRARNLRQPVRSLSGGNQQKVVIGKWLGTEPAVFILDEPTRGVDVGAKLEVYTIVADLAAKGAGVLVISSELEELIGVCDRILVMADGEIMGGFPRARFDRERILAAAFREQVEEEATA